MKFDDLKLITPLLEAVKSQGYTEPTPIQERSIPSVLEGKDLLGIAQTGTGKTAAFALPLLQRMIERPNIPAAGFPRTLVLSPTRELAAQIGESFETYGKNLSLRTRVIFGGVGQKPQVDALRKGVHVLVATPGRLLDLMGQGHVSLEEVEFFVLDEADRMLDMGFIHDIKKIIPKLPSKRQSLFFSATMPKVVSELAHSLLQDPVRVEVTPQATTVEKIAQSAYFVDAEHKDSLLLSLLSTEGVGRTLVFTRTKHRANKVVKTLEKEGISAMAIHGNKSQTHRTKALSDFKNGRVSVLVATDIAARGIDVEGITHVVNYEVPNEPESYVHRIGRTARAGSSGMAWTFVAPDERGYLTDIEKVIRMKVPVVREHTWHSEKAERSTGPESRMAAKKAQVRRGGGSSRGSSLRGSGSRGSGQRRGFRK